MKQIKGIIRIIGAILFAYLLFAAYSISKETIGPIIGYKLIWPLDILPKNHYSPWYDVIGLSTFLLSLIPASLLCGLLFGYLFRRKTALWAIVPSIGLVAYFLMSLLDHRYYWHVYFESGFLILSFIFFSVTCSKLHQKLIIERSHSKINQDAKLKRVIFVSVILVTVVGAGWLHFCYPLLGTRVSGDDFEGIILSKEQYPEGWWKIEDKDIKILEDRLKSYVKTHRYMLTTRLVNELPSYRRWYHAKLSAAGEKQINVFLHRSHVSRAAWLHVMFGVLGGGDNYWHMTYNLKDGTFKDVRCNADA